MLGTRLIWVTSTRFTEELQGKTLRMDFPQAPSPHYDLGELLRTICYGTLDFKKHDDGRIAVSVVLLQPFANTEGLRLTAENIDGVKLDPHAPPGYTLSFDHPAESILACPRQTDS